MLLLSTLPLSILFIYRTLATSPHPLLITEPNPNSILPPPDVLTPRVPSNWLTTQSTATHVTWGNYAITFWESTAILPVVAAAQPLAGFYQQATLAAVQAVGAHLVTHSYMFGKGALNLYVDTLDGGPVDWQMVLLFVGNRVGATKRGWTNHYAAVVKDRVAGVLTLVSLEAAGGAAMAWLGSGTSMEQFRNDPIASW